MRIIYIITLFTIFTAAIFARSSFLGEKIASLEQSSTNAKSSMTGDLVPYYIYVGLGYDAYVGNPLSDQIDPGIKYQPVFKFTYQKNRPLFNNFVVPDGEISITRQSNCKVESKTSTFDNMESYNKVAKGHIQAGADALFGLVSFKASVDYLNVDKMINEENKVIFHVEASCQTAKETLPLSLRYPLTENFKEAVIQAYTTKDYRNIFSQFGTHYIYEAQMGGRLFYEKIVTKKHYSNIQTSDMNITTVTTIDLFFFQITSESTTPKTSSQVSEFNSYVEEEHDYYIGSDAPADKRWETWTATVDVKPAPIGLTLKPIKELIDYSLFKDNNKVTAQMISEVQKGYEEYVGKLCNNGVYRCSSK